MEKTIQLNITKRSVSANTISFQNKNLSSELLWKYSGVNRDHILNSVVHIDYVRTKLRKQCRIAAKIVSKPFRVVLERSSDSYSGRDKS